MANILTDRENAVLGPTLKIRQRLQSAPEKLWKSPMPCKPCLTPLPSSRKAFGAVNKIATPAVNVEEKKLMKPQETKVEHVPQTKLAEYPEIEKFFPYDPSEFEKYNIAEDLIPLGNFALPGLACFRPLPPLPEDDIEVFAPVPHLSPVEMQNSPGCQELDAFLQTLDELTVDLPPEPDADY